MTEKSLNALFLTLLSGFVCTALPLTSASSLAAESQSMQQALVNPRRDVAHFLRDEIRKPVQVIEFLGIEPGMKVLDIYAADGYYSYILSHAVGDSGIVYAQNPATGSNVEDIRQMYSLADSLDETIARVPLENVTHLREGFFELSIEAASLDAIMLVQILHDFYNDSDDNGGVYAVALLAQLKSLLKPGGIIGMIDHHGDPEADNERLHRMEKQEAIELAEGLGLVLTGDSELLRNSVDRRRRPVFDPMLGRNTDRFLLKLQN